MPKMQDHERDKAGRIIPRTERKPTPVPDFERNRNGLYGGLPKTRAPDAGVKPNAPHPSRKPR